MLSCASRLQDPSPRQARRNRARLPRQAQGKHALRMAAQERILHLLFARRGGRKDPRRTQVQAGGNALATPQRRMRLRHHRQTALRSMRTAAMDDYFFNKIKSHPYINISVHPCNFSPSVSSAGPDLYNVRYVKCLVGAGTVGFLELVAEVKSKGFIGDLNLTRNYLYSYDSGIRY